MKEEVRIDKWLWATRIFKTRTIASDACKKGRVTIKGQNVKPSHGIRVGQAVEVRKPPVTYSFEVLGLIENRVGAKLVPNYLKNVTSRDQLELLEMVKISGFVNLSGVNPGKIRINLEKSGIFRFFSKTY